MKNNYSIAERNRIVEEHLWCIDRVIRKNRSLMRAARLDYDDVYQQLSIRLIRAVAGFDPQKGKLKQHIFAQLRFELLNCKRPYRMFGMTGLPADYRGKKSSRSRITWNDTAERSPMASSCRREMDVQSVMETVSTSCCKNNNIQWRTYRYEHSFDAG